MEAARYDDPAAPLRALGAQFGRNPVGFVAALTGHFVALMAVPAPLVGVAMGIAAFAGDDRAMQATAGVLLALAMLAWFAAFVLWRPVLDAGLVRALDAEIDEGQALSLWSAYDRASGDAGAVIGSRLLVDVLSNFLFVFGMPLLAVPVAVARGEGVSVALDRVVRDVFARPVWHLGAWALWLVVCLAGSLLWFPATSALPVAYAAHVQRCMGRSASASTDGDGNGDADAEEGDPIDSDRAGSTASGWLWAIALAMFAANGVDLLFSLQYFPFFAAPKFWSHPELWIFGGVLALRALIGWGTALVVAISASRPATPNAPFVSGVALAVSLLMCFLSMISGCCFAWLLAVVFAAVGVSLPRPPAAPAPA